MPESRRPLPLKRCPQPYCGGNLTREPAGSFVRDFDRIYCVSCGRDAFELPPARTEEDRRIRAIFDEPMTRGRRPRALREAVEAAT